MPLKVALQSLFLGSLLLAGPVVANTHSYDAYVGGLKVGEASVSVDIAAGEYQVSGKARAVGFSRLLTAWRSLFSVRGRLRANGAHADSMQLLQEKKRKRTKEILIEDGTVAYFKNGKQKFARPAPESTDILTALFAKQDCQQAKAVHNGKDIWQVELLREHQDADTGARVCEFSVTDDANRTFAASVRFVQLGGRSVLTHFKYGSRRLELKNAQG